MNEMSHFHDHNFWRKVIYLGIKISIDFFQKFLSINFLDPKSSFDTVWTAPEELYLFFVWTLCNLSSSLF